MPAYRGGSGKGQHRGLWFQKIRTDGPFKSGRVTDADGVTYKSTKVKGPADGVVLRVYYAPPNSEEELDAVVHVEQLLKILPDVVAVQVGHRPGGDV